MLDDENWRRGKTVRACSRPGAAVMVERGLLRLVPRAQAQTGVTTEGLNLACARHRIAASADRGLGKVDRNMAIGWAAGNGGAGEDWRCKMKPRTQRTHSGRREPQSKLCRASEQGAEQTGPPLWSRDVRLWWPDLRTRATFHPALMNAKFIANLARTHSPRFRQRACYALSSVAFQRTRNYERPPPPGGQQPPRLLCTSALAAPARLRSPAGDHKVPPLWAFRMLTTEPTAPCHRAAAATVGPASRGLAQ